MGQEAEEESKRRQAARKRAAEEKLARLEAAAEHKRRCRRPRRPRGVFWVSGGLPTALEKRSKRSDVDLANPKIEF
jgi:hypothetical protein